jgi:ABC-type sugar transport system ATPase subunit
MSETTSHDPIIIARDVQKWYGHFKALKGVSMEVTRGGR